MYKAHQQRYEIHIIEAVVVESSENIYKEMIDFLYNQRREIKALMKPLAKKI